MPIRHRPIRPLTRPGIAFLALMLLALLVPSATAVSARGATPPADGHSHGHDHEHAAEHREPTLEEQEAADRLLRATRAEAERYADFSVAERDGYRMVTPFAFYGARAAHFQRGANLVDGRVLDPRRPEQLIYLRDDSGELTLVGVMYLAPIGQGPAIGGPLTQWHSHDDMCVNASGLVPVLPTGGCAEGTVQLGLEMLHIWLIDHPESPFADLPPPSIVTEPTPWDDTGGSLAAGAMLIDWDALLAELGGLLGLDAAEAARRMEAGKSWAEMAAKATVPRGELEAVVMRRILADYDRAVAGGDMLPAHRDLVAQVLPEVIGRIVELHKGEPWIVE